MHRSRIDLSGNVREAAIQILNARLADTLDLNLATKQAHWNVRGPNFIALYEFFDTLHTTTEGLVDTIAERVTALGGQAYGTSQVTAAKSTLEPYPVDAVSEGDHLEALADRFAHLGRLAREAIEEAGRIGDADTQDLFTGMSRELDKQLWFIESHLHRG